MKTTKRVCSLLLALLMMVSLLPAPALAEPAPAFTLQPESGTYAPGESYLLTWELNQTPDRLELVREEPAEDGGLDVPPEEPVLVPVEELEPEATSLELTAPEEETVFHLRAFYGEEELLSEPFTVTEEAEPASPEREDSEQSEEEGSEPLSQLPEELTAPLTEEPAEEPVEADAPGDPADDPAEPVEADEPEAMPTEPVADDPNSVFQFTTQPQDGSYSGSTLKYHCTWVTNFTPKRVEIRHYTGTYSAETYDEITGFTDGNGSYDFPATSGEQRYYIKAYYGTGTGDYIYSDDFTVTPENLQFTTQPQDGSYSTSTLKYHCTWKTSFTPKRVEIRHYTGTYSAETTDEITSGLSSNGSYDFPATAGEQRYYIKAFYGTGSGDYVMSDDFTVTPENLQFTTQPQDGSYSTSTLKYHCTWVTSFTPKRVEIRHYTGIYSAETTDEISSGLSSNGSYDFPATAGEQRYYIKVYYGTGSGDYVMSDDFTVTPANLQFTTQPQSGSFDPGSLSYIATWQLTFTPLLVEIRHYTGAYSAETYDLITNDLSSTGSYEFPAVAGEQRYYLKAYYGTGSGDYVMSDDFTVSDHDVVTSGDCGFMDPTSVHWSYANHTLTLSGTGFMGDFTSLTTVPWNHLRSQITTVVVEEGVQNVGAYAFRNCLCLETVYLPSTVKKIGNYAFDNCPELTDAWINMGEADFDDVVWEWGANMSLAAATRHFAWRAKGTCGANLTWRLVDSTLIIEGSGTMYNYSESSRPMWFQYRDEITAIQLSGAASIGNYAFAYFTKLESVTIPSTVTQLGTYAFTGCTKLKSVSIQNANVNIPNYGFYNCSSLKSITIPKNASTIGTAAFYGCSSLTTVTFPSGSALTTIGSSAFQNCTSLSSVVLPNSLTTINSSAFKGCTALTKVIAYSGTQLQTIGDSAFEGCRKLNTFTMASGITSIGARAFYNCVSLPEIKLPAGLTSLGNYSFYGCTGATGTITIPAGVTSIPSGCFQNCSGVYQVSFGTQMQNIYSMAFNGCSKLKYVSYDGFKSQYQVIRIDNTNTPLLNASIHYLYISGTIPNTNIYYEINGATGELYITGWDEMPGGQTPWYEYGQYITEVEISGGITKIGYENFRGCPNITTVRLPGSLRTVDDRAFQECIRITDVYYDGLASDWEDIDFTTDNDPLLNATLHTGTVGGLVDGTDIYWSLDDEGTLTLYFDMDCGYTDLPDFQDNRAQPWYEYADQIVRVRISEGVTSIGDENFTYLTRLEEVEIPSSVTRIGIAFPYCYSLETIVLPDTVETLEGGVFWNCGNLETVTLPAGLTAIPGSLFYGCGTLSNVYMPSTVTSIGNNAFPGGTDFASVGDLYFDGSSAQWAAITKGSGNEALNTCRIHFNPPELAIDATNFPDENFRNYVKAYLDSDGSGWLTDEERLAVTQISCGAEDIASLRGIQFFPELTYLDCSDNELDGELDLTGNLKLQTVICSYNSDLDDLNVEGLTELFTLSFSDCENLSSPDLSTNIGLHVLDCSGCQLSALDLSANRELTVLRCFNNHLSELDLSAQTELRQLYCSSNELETLDVTACTYLYALDCSSNALQTLTLGELPALKELYCNANSLVSLDLIGCPLLLTCVTDESSSYTETPGYCEYRLGEFVLRADKSLLFITDHDGIPVDAAHFPDPAFRAYVAENLDLNRNGYLKGDEIEAATVIYCQEQGVASLTGIAYFPNLETLDCGYNALTGSLDLTSNPKLKTINLDCNELGELIVDGLTELESLSFMGNLNLGSLDLSRNTALKVLDCGECGLTELDLSANTELVELYCHGNELTTLDLSAQSKLQHLDCYENQLQSLDLSNNPLLTFVDCYSNQLQTLNLGVQTALLELYCDSNQLTSLDLTRSPWLLDCVVNEEANMDDGGTYYDYYIGSAVLRADKTVVIVTEHDGIPVDEEHFPDAAFRAYVAANCDTDHDGWLTDAEREAVTVLYLGNKGIASLQGIQYFTELDYLECYRNNLSELDLSANTKLSYLCAFGNPLTELDLTANTALNMIEMSDTPSLTTLHVAGLPYLDYIDVSRCGLTELDVTGCPLYYLECEYNPLTSLTLGEKPDLTYLECHHASLTELDISLCPMLADAYLHGTRSDDEDYVSYDSGDAWLAIDEGVNVVAATYVPGDINGDGKVTNKDVTRLQRYLKGATTDVNVAALDVNGDGKVNNKDLTRLQRFLKDSSVEIY